MRKNHRIIPRKYRKRLNVFPWAVFLVILAASAALSWRCLGNFFKTSPFFNVSRIELIMRPVLKDALSIDFYNIRRGSNVFQLDIDRIGSDTQKRHPEFKSVTVSRKLPNVISVRIEYKNPVAYFKTSSKVLPISSDGIILPAEAAAGKNLPVISGINFQESKKLASGIKFIMLAQSCWTMKNHRIDVLDLINTKDISIFLENGIEVKVGDGNAIKAKLTVLKNVMNEPSFDFAKIKYIDLRFSDVVIGPKNKLTGK